MPSLHAGFALAVVATGNHFVFDIVAGCATTALGHLLGHVLRLRRRALLPRPAGARMLKPADYPAL